MMWTSKEYYSLPETSRRGYKRCQSCKLYVANRNHKRHEKACYRGKRELQAKQHEQWLKDFKAGTLTPRTSA